MKHEKCAHSEPPRSPYHARGALGLLIHAVARKPGCGGFHTRVHASRLIAPHARARRRCLLRDSRPWQSVNSLAHPSRARREPRIATAPHQSSRLARFPWSSHHLRTAPPAERRKLADGASSHWPTQTRRYARLLYMGKSHVLPRAIPAQWERLGTHRAINGKEAACDPGWLRKGVAIRRHFQVYCSCVRWAFSRRSGAATLCLHAHKDVQTDVEGYAFE